MERFLRAVFALVEMLKNELVPQLLPELVPLKIRIIIDKVLSWFPFLFIFFVRFL